jgi:hypothetical protein
MYGYIYIYVLEYSTSRGQVVVMFNPSHRELGFGDGPKPLIKLQNMLLNRDGVCSNYDTDYQVISARVFTGEVLQSIQRIMDRKED